jgi:hypothetical protein
MRTLVFGAILCSGCWVAAAPVATKVEDIVQRSINNTNADWQGAPHYDYTERDVIVKGQQTVKTYEVHMIEGSTYNRLIALDGKPLRRHNRPPKSTK